MDAMTAAKDVIAEKQGPAGRLRLNRPKALHSLNRQMVRDMANALLEWRDDPDVRIILIDHAEGRGFCAGGDVVGISQDVEGHEAAARAFFFDEYRLNHLEYTYPKPGVAFMDGITMGGGVGIACPCRFRVATERTVFAMPETTIGIFPDVGGGWYLPRLPGRVGEFMALTGARLDGAECHYLGLATHYVEQASLADIWDRIATTPQRVQGPIGAFAATPPDTKIAANLPNITKLFASDRLEDVLAALEADGSDWATTELATLRTKSPLSCKVSLRLLAEGASREDFADEMRAEYALAGRVVRTHDFREGVRALLIDKDNAPHWDPPTPEEVTDEMLDVLFAPLPESEAWTPFPETENERV
jgi:enoyl-CoA hydratase